MSDSLRTRSSVLAQVMRRACGGQMLRSRQGSAMEASLAIGFVVSFLAALLVSLQDAQPIASPSDGWVRSFGNSRRIALNRATVVADWVGWLSSAATIGTMPRAWRGR